MFWALALMSAFNFPLVAVLNAPGSACLRAVLTSRSSCALKLARILLRKMKRRSAGGARGFIWLPSPSKSKIKPSLLFGGTLSVNFFSSCRTC